MPYNTYVMDIISFILHIDEHLQNLVQNLGIFSYLILFGIIFVETGLVVVPFLPGDSLLFVSGTLAAAGMLKIQILIPLLICAAITGDSLNYYIGSRIGPKVFSKNNSKVFKPAYLAKTQKFYERHGGKTIIFARFLPIVRTFAPFLAGVGDMKYIIFLAYSITGSIVWVTSLTLAGYYFGNIPIIKDNFEIAIISIILVSFIPAILEVIKHSRSPKTESEKVTTYADLKQTFKKSHLDD
jgi:membrane-associated protein